MSVISHLPEFKLITVQKLDKAFDSMAHEVEREAKQIVPHDKGILQSSIHAKKLGSLQYRVTVGEQPGVAYARFQEEGGDSKRKVKNYSKSGKQAHFLRDSGERVASKAEERIRMYL